jgi:hypothetical protein
VEAPVTLDAIPSSGKKSKAHPPKPYDIVQEMEHVIDMMEDTLQICKRVQHSPQDVSHRKTFPFGLRECVHTTGSKVNPDPIWVTTTIWRPQGRTSHTTQPSRRTVHLPQGCTAHAPWLSATKEDRSGARRHACHTGSHVSGQRRVSEVLDPHLPQRGIQGVLSGV